MRPRARAASRERGWDADTDVIFTTDHGELQGDYGLVFKGPFHTDALMRLPMVWRPAPSAGVAPAVVAEPVGQLDLAPTFCAIAGVPAPEWMQGAPLPTAPGSGRERVLCEWDSQFPGYGMHLRTIYRDGWLCTAYEPSTIGEPNGLEEFFAATGMFGGGIGPVSPVAYDGTEGELYNVEDDPHQWENRWDDPACKALREDLVADLYDNLPADRTVLKVAPSVRLERRGGARSASRSRTAAALRPTGARGRSRSRRRRATPRSPAAPTASPASRRSGCRSRATAPSSACRTGRARARPRARARRRARRA